jgi:hypothetical protein
LDAEEEVEFFLPKEKELPRILLANPDLKVAELALVGGEGRLDSGPL